MDFEKLTAFAEVLKVPDKAIVDEAQQCQLKDLCAFRSGSTPRLKCFSHTPLVWGP